MRPGETRQQRILRQYGVLDQSHLDYPMDPPAGWNGLSYSGAFGWGHADDVFPDTDPPEEVAE